MELRNVMDTWTMLAFHKLSRHPQMITVDSKTTIRNSLQVMHENNILSAPVINNSTTPPNILGFVDMFDVLSYLIESWDEVMSSTQEHPEKILQRLFLLDHQFLNHPVADLPDRSDNNLFAAVIEEETASRLLKLYALGVHRVALIDMQGEVRSVVAQSDLIRFLNDSKGLLGETANKTIRELGLIRESELVVVKSEQPTIDAFKLLALNSISAAPIVNSQGSLAGTLSVSDLRALRKDPLSALLQPVRDFKELGEGTTINVVCTPHDTLSDVLAMLAGTHVHRVWVTNDNDEPISVISLTTVCDVIATICGIE